MECSDNLHNAQSSSNAPIHRIRPETAYLPNGPIYILGYHMIMHSANPLPEKTELLSFSLESWRVSSFCQRHLKSGLRLTHYDCRIMVFGMTSNA